MTILNFALVNEGDWISGTTSVDEKFIGFVQSMDEEGILKVCVTQSDREAIVGTTIQAKLAKVKKLSESTLSSPAEVRSMIELALGTHDKEWFDLLSAKMTTLSAVASDLSGGFTLTELKGRL
jgi:hypothetical protein